MFWNANAAAYEKLSNQNAVSNFFDSYLLLPD